MKQTTIKEGLINHPDLYELIKTIGADDMIIADGGTASVIVTEPSSKLTFQFTKTGNGYDLTIEDTSI